MNMIKCPMCGVEILNLGHIVHKHKILCLREFTKKKDGKKKLKAHLLFKEKLQEQEDSKFCYCTKCNQMWPLTKDYWHKDRNKKTDLIVGVNNVYRMPI